MPMVRVKYLPMQDSFIYKYLTRLSKFKTTISIRAASILPGSKSALKRIIQFNYLMINDALQDIVSNKTTLSLPTICDFF